MKNILSLIIALSVLFCSKINAQYSGTDLQSYDVTLNYSKTVILYSDVIKDSFYIYIKLPKDNYGNSEESYPAIFLLDGDIAFPMAWSVVRYLQYAEHVPDVLIIGIGYGGLMKSNVPNKRSRDYSISTISGIAESNGGELFLQFLKNELIPFISSNFRMDKSNMTLSGHSLGGLFVLYTLFKEPELFSNYISSSPYTYYDLETLLALEEKKLNNFKSMRRRFFISNGANEDEAKYIKPIIQIVNRLKQSESDNFQMNYKVFDGGSHFTTPSEALSYGLKFCFE
ncbi:MAG: alpha/beta hydrolase-fold protein [Ignavibacteriaceae bacterium]